MTARERPAVGGSRPAYVISPDYAGEQSAAADELLAARRHELLDSYERSAAAPPLQLSLGALAFANLVERVATEPTGTLQGAELLPASLGTHLHRERERLLGVGVPHPVTTDDIDWSGGSAAEKWAARELQNPWFLKNFNSFVPELGRVASSGDPNAARLAMVKCLWPVQVTLRQPALKQLYEQMVQPLEPTFTPLYRYLGERGVRRTVARIVVARWRRECYSDRGVLFKPRVFKRELKRARERVRAKEMLA